MSHAELPEHQIFHILKVGQEEPIGPYSQDELVELLNTQQIQPSDYVYYPELSGWKPLSQVFDLHQEITNFDDDGQDRQVVADVFAFMEKRSEPNEEIFYIAVQHLPALSLTAAVRLTAPKALVLTNCRFCMVHDRLLGDTEFEEYPIDQVEGAIKKIKPGAKYGIFNIVMRSGDWVEVDKIPIVQLEKLEQHAYAVLESLK